MAKLLGRTLILPLFCLYTSVPGVYGGSADWCTAEGLCPLLLTTDAIDAGNPAVRVMQAVRW
eukprot:3776644-Rhodomonas_salina.2